MARFANQEEAAAGQRQDLYFSVDVETSGLVPLYHSMFSFGVAAIREEKIVGTFTRNLITLDPFIMDNTDNPPDISTGTFWKQYPKAWEAHRSGLLETPYTAFRKFGVWVDGLTKPSEIPVFLAYPASFDFAWMLAYAQKFAPEYWRFAFAGFCMQSYAAALLNVSFSQARQKNWPLAWTQGTGDHPHVALDDALQQAKTFINMRKWGQKHLRNVYKLGRGNVPLLGENENTFRNENDAQWF